MGIVTRLLEKRTTLANPAQWLIDWFSGGGASHAGVTVNETTALNVTTVYACVRILAETVASLPLPVYRRLPGGGKERAQDHYLYSLLHDQPNPEMTSLELREALMGHMALWGNAYAEIERDNAGRAIGLWPLRPDRMTVRRVNGALAYEYQVPNGAKVALAPGQVLHLRGLSPDGIIGYSPIRLAREAIGLALATEEFGARFFGDGAHPGGIVEYPGKLSRQQIEEYKQSVTKAYAGLGKAHRLMVLEEGLKYTQVGIPPDDAQFLQTRRFQVEEIARFFRIPPHMLADLERATFCLPSDAEVYTDEGPKRIVDIHPGELVWSRRDEGGLMLSRVERVSCSGVDRIFRIATTNRVVRMNAQHRVLARRQVLRPLRPGELGGRNIGGKKYRVEWATDYVPAGQLRIGDTIVVFDGTPDSGKWETPTRRTTIGFMEFCGLYLGDGYMTDSHVTIARAKNAPYMDHYREVIRQEFSRYDGGNGRGDRRSVRRAPVTLVEDERYTRFASVEAVAELRALGLGGTAHEKHVPGWVFGLADELKLAFLRGFLDADGSVDKKGRITFSSCNKELLSGIRHLCMSLGIPVTNVTERIGHTRLPNGRMAPVHQYAFTCSDPGANLRIGSHDSRYVERLQNGRPFGRKARRYPRHGGRGFSEPGVELSRIVAIEAEGEEPVYDLTVVDTHSFIADGVVVHNSNIEHQSIEFVVHTIRPWLVRWEQAIRKNLFLPQERGKYFAEFLVDGLLRGDIKSRYEAYAVGRQNGWLSADDIRELENMNPLPNGQGKVYLVPLNMVPADSVTTLQGSASTTAGQRSVFPPEERATRAATSRRRLASQFERLFRSVEERIVKREAADIRQAVQRFLGRRDSAQFLTWLEQFYSEHQEFMLRSRLPAYLTYADAVQAAAAEEIASKAEMTPALQDFVRAYLVSHGALHAASAAGQLRQLVTDAIAAGDDPAPWVEARLQEWEQKRPDKTAQRETVQAGNAVAREVYAAAGIRKLRWHAFGENCPYCSALNGRTVGIDSTFLAAGESLQPDGADHPLTTSVDVRHPPGHDGCDCQITAAL